MRRLDDWMTTKFRRALLVAGVGAALLAAINGALVTTPQVWAAEEETQIACAIPDSVRVIVRRRGWAAPHRWRANTCLAEVVSMLTATRCQCYGPPIPRKPVCICWTS